MLAGVLLTFFFVVAWNVPKVFEELEAKRNIVIHHDQVTHPFKWGLFFNDRLFPIFHYGWIDCRDTFMLFSVYNTV